MDETCGDVGKFTWPELLGVQGTVAAETIRRENTSVRVILRPPGSIGITDFDCSRVWLWVDANGIVNRVPSIG